MVVTQNNIDKQQTMQYTQTDMHTPSVHPHGRIKSCLYICI